MTELDRRRFIRIAAAGTAVGLAGCSTGDDSESSGSTDTEEMGDGMTESGMTESDMDGAVTDSEMTDAEMSEAEMTEAEMTDAGTEEMTDAEMTEAEMTDAEMTDSMGTTETFTVTVTNVSEPGTITTSDGEDVAVPLSPTGYAVHTHDATVFEEGTSASDGLESLAEDGAPGTFVTEAEMNDGVERVGAVTTADEADSAGPLLPGQSYTFEVEACHDHHLTLASMFVQSNDLFYAPEPAGIALFDDGDPVDGDATDQLVLWDAGTEQNQEPGAGADQAPRQSGPDTGPEEDATVRPVDQVMDGHDYPDVSEVIEVSLSTM